MTKPRRNQRQGQSAPATEKDEPLIVELLFSDPGDAITPDATAKVTPPSSQESQNGRQLLQPSESERIIFRFSRRS